MKRTMCSFCTLAFSFLLIFMLAAQDAAAVQEQSPAADVSASVSTSVAGAGATTTLTVTKVGKGTITITPKQATYTFGQIVTLSAQPDAGWSFLGWDGDLASGVGWFDPQRNYRVAIAAAAKGYARYEKPAEIDVNFTTLLASLAESGALDEASLRLVEVDADGVVVSADVPFQFDKAANYNAATNAKGAIVLIMQGTTAANSSRFYHLYFDVAGKSFTPVVVPPQVIVTTGVQDEGFASIKFQTPIGSYWYHTDGGGFSSFDDVDGNDWLSYSTAPGATGAYRGIPNMIHPEGLFHPGGNGVNTTLVAQGPLKATTRSLVTINGVTWEALWEIYPRYAKMTLLQARADYWFLFEGTPGGVLEANDFATLSTGQQIPYNGVWNGELPNDEWAYFSDPNSGAAGRSLFVAQHEDDTQPDSYRKLGQANSMTIWAFGRNTQTEQHFLTGTPKHFTFGLVDETALTPTSNAIYSAYKNIEVALAGAERMPTVNALAINPSPTITVSMVMDRKIVATFTRNQLFSLTINVVDENGAPNPQGGAVTATPPTLPRGYQLGEIATLTATAAPGWTFIGWGGSLTGANPVAQLTFDGNETVTATFARQYYTLDLQIIDNDSLNQRGGVTVTPPADPRGYVYGESATLNATATVGWSFQGWSGSLIGNNPQSTLTFDGNETVTATFTQDHYTLTIHRLDLQGRPSPQGSVQVTPPANPAGYVYGESATLTASASTGWIFKEWRGSLSGTNPQQTLTFDGNETVTAIFDAINYALEILVVDEHGKPTTGGTVTAAPPSNPLGYVFGETTTVTATAAAGWSFQGWSGDLSGNDPTQTMTFDSNKLVVAAFTQKRYTIQTNTLNEEGQPVAAGSISLSQPTQAAGYVYGEVVTVTVTPQAGWAFLNWSGSLAGFANPTTLTVDGNEVVNAIFGQAQYTLLLTPSNTEGGAIIADPAGPYAHGQVVTLRAESNPGWRFDGWSGDLTGTVNPTTLTMNGNKTVNAAFSPGQYRLTIEVVGGQGNPGGTVMVTPLKEHYAYNEEVTLTAIPAAGYRFSSWEITENSHSLTIPAITGPTEPVITIKITTDITYQAKFDLIAANLLFLPVVVQAN